MGQATAKQIISTLGRDRITGALGVSRYTIRHYEQSGVFPAAWFNGLDTLCREAGIECPRDIFNWKTSDKVVS